MFPYRRAYGAFSEPTIGALQCGDGNSLNPGFSSRSVIIASPDFASHLLCRTVVVTEKAPGADVAEHSPGDAALQVDQLVAEPLMVAFAMMVDEELGERTAEVPLPQRNKTAQAFLFDGQGSRHSPSMVVDCLLLMTKTRQKSDLLQGTLDLLILRTLQWGPQHGHGIGVALRASSDEVLNVDHGSLYPALHRLERQGWVDAEWKLSDNRQRAKYYRITAAGRRQLALERTRWSRLSAAIAKVLGPA
jgi:PadR family transcriptional regulator PadR